MASFIELSAVDTPDESLAFVRTPSLLPPEATIMSYQIANPVMNSDINIIFGETIIPAPSEDITMMSNMVHRNQFSAIVEEGTDQLMHNGMDSITTVALADSFTDTAILHVDLDCSNDQPNCIRTLAHEEEPSVDSKKKKVHAPLHRLSVKEKEMLIDLIINEKKTSREVAHIMGRPQSTVASVIKVFKRKNGLQSKPAAGIRKVESKNNKVMVPTCRLSQDQKDMIIDLIFNEKITSREVACHMKRSQSTITSVVSAYKKKNGIHSKLPAGRKKTLKSDLLLNSDASIEPPVVSSCRLSLSQREKIIDLVFNEKKTSREVARIMERSQSTIMSVIQVFKKEHRIHPMRPVGRKGRDTGIQVLDKTQDVIDAEKTNTEKNDDISCLGKSWFIDSLHTLTNFVPDVDPSVGKKKKSKFPCRRLSLAQRENILDLIFNQNKSTREVGRILDRPQSTIMAVVQLYKKGNGLNKEMSNKRKRRLKTAPVDREEDSHKLESGSFLGFPEPLETSVPDIAPLINTKKRNPKITVRRLSPARRKTKVDMVLNEKKTVREFARTLNMSQATIMDIVRQNKIETGIDQNTTAVNNERLNTAETLDREETTAMHDVDPTALLYSPACTTWNSEVEQPSHAEQKEVRIPLQRLTPAEREKIISLIYSEKRTAREVAKCIGRPESTIRTVVRLFSREHRINTKMAAIRNKRMSIQRKKTISKVPMRRLSQEQKKMIIHLVVNERKTMKQVSCYLGRSHSTVRSVIVAFRKKNLIYKQIAANTDLLTTVPKVGMDTDKNDMATEITEMEKFDKWEKKNPTLCGSYLSHVDREMITDLYFQQKKSSREIARVMDLSQTTVMSVILRFKKQHKIRIRPRPVHSSTLSSDQRNMITDVVFKDKKAPREVADNMNLPHSTVLSVTRLYRKQNKCKKMAANCKTPIRKDGEHCNSSYKDSTNLLRTPDPDEKSSIKSKIKAPLRRLSQTQKELIIELVFNQNKSARVVSCYLGRAPSTVMSVILAFRKKNLIYKQTAANNELLTTLPKVGMDIDKNDMETLIPEMEKFNEWEKKNPRLCGRYLSPVQREKITYLYFKQKKSSRKIARVMDLAQTTVMSVILRFKKQHKIRIRPRACHSSTLSADQRKMITDLVFTDNKATREVADNMNLPHSTVLSVTRLYRKQNKCKKAAANCKTLLSVRKDDRLRTPDPDEKPSINRKIKAPLRRLSPTQKELIIDLVFNEKKSTRAVARILGRAQSTVMSVIQVYKKENRIHKNSAGGGHKLLNTDPESDRVLVHHDSSTNLSSNDLTATIYPEVEQSIDIKRTKSIVPRQRLSSAQRNKIIHLAFRYKQPLREVARSLNLGQSIVFAVIVAYKRKHKIKKPTTRRSIRLSDILALDMNEEAKLLDIAPGCVTSSDFFPEKKIFATSKRKQWTISKHRLSPAQRELIVDLDFHEKLPCREIAHCMNLAMSTVTQVVEKERRLARMTVGGKLIEETDALNTCSGSQIFDKHIRTGPSFQPATLANEVEPSIVRKNRKSKVPLRRISAAQREMIINLVFNEKKSCREVARIMDRTQPLIISVVQSYKKENKTHKKTAGGVVKLLTIPQKSDKDAGLLEMDLGEMTNPPNNLTSLSELKSADNLKRSSNVDENESRRGSAHHMEMSKSTVMTTKSTDSHDGIVTAVHAWDGSKSHNMLDEHLGVLTDAPQCPTVIPEMDPCVASKGNTMVKSRKLSNAQKDMIFDLIINEKKTTREVARYMGFSQSKVMYGIQAYRKEHKLPVTMPKRRLTADQEIQLFQIFQEGDNCTGEEIRTRFHQIHPDFGKISMATIYRALGRVKKQASQGEDRKSVESEENA